MNKEQKTSQTTEPAIAVDTVLATVFISEIAPYNEYDHACNGGYFNCPNCNHLEYVSESEHGKIDECSSCGKSFVFNCC